MKPLDAIDSRLLALLQDHARQPLVGLAKAVGLSRSATQERLRRLESSGIIAKYTIRLGSPQRPQVQAWLTLKLQPGVSCFSVIPALEQMPEIKLCHSVTGVIDVIVLSEADSIPTLASLRERIAAVPGVASVETTPVLLTHIDRR